MADATSLLSRFLYRVLPQFFVGTAGPVVTLHVTTTQAGNAGTGEDALATYTLPGGTLAVDGQYVVIEAWGSWANTANTKTTKVSFGSLQVAANTSTTANVKWQTRSVVVRTSGTTQDGYGTLLRGTSIAYNTPFSGTETLSGDVTIQVTGESAEGGDDDVVLEGMIVTLGGPSSST